MTTDAHLELALIVAGRKRAQNTYVQQLAWVVPETFLAKSAVIAARSSYNQLAAVLLAVLTFRDVELLARVFHRAVLNAATLRSYVAILRSKGRKSLGTRPKKLIREWLNQQPAWLLQAEAFGRFRPSLADIVRWTHPKPVDKAHSEVFAWMVGRAERPQHVPADTLATKPLSETYRENPSQWRVRSLSLVEEVEL